MFEEPDLVEDIGEPYKQYQKEVPPFCPQFFAKPKPKASDAK